MPMTPEERVRERAALEASAHTPFPKFDRIAPPPRPRTPFDPGSKGEEKYLEYLAKGFSPREAHHQTWLWAQGRIILFVLAFPAAWVLFLIGAGATAALIDHFRY